MLVVQHDNGLHESHRVIFFTVFFLFFRHSRFHGLDTVFVRSFVVLLPEKSVFRKVSKIDANSEMGRE